MFIYLIVNQVTGKYYVGQHKGNNLKKYLQTKLSDAKHRRASSSHLFNSMRKNPDPSVWSIHALLSDVQTRTELDQHERDFIAFLKSQDPDYGYNICRGGEGFTGPHSEEAKQKTREGTKLWWTSEQKVIQSKISKAWWTPERRAANAERMKNQHYALGQIGPNRGKKFSEEYRQKLSTAHSGQVPWNRGKTHSEETRFKMSQAALKREARKRHTETDGLDKAIVERVSL